MAELPDFAGLAGHWHTASRLTLTLLSAPYDAFLGLQGNHYCMAFSVPRIWNTVHGVLQRNVFMQQILG